MPTAQPLVSVVVPLYNGAATVERTLSSVLAQTWSNLEVLVVDDGSTDDGPERVAAIAAADDRVRILRQTNGGVAEARNHGAAHSRSDFLAFVDADDLWAPRKVELQMQALQQGGDRVGLVYTWAALIDAEDRIYSTAHRPRAEGDVFRELCRGNFIANGSSALMRRAAFDSVGGYDPSLRERGAQGCEDLMIYLAIAERYEFRLVPAFLTGYRVVQGSMSSDARKMLQSWEMTLAAYRDRYPQFAAEFRNHRREMIYWLALRAFTMGPLKPVAPLLMQHWGLNALGLFPRAPSLAWISLKARTPAFAKRTFWGLLRRGVPKRPSYFEAAV